VGPDPAAKRGVDKYEAGEQGVVNGLLRLTIPEIKRRYNLDARGLKYCAMYSTLIGT
jgi:hypothetical protein